MSAIPDAGPRPAESNKDPFGPFGERLQLDPYMYIRFDTEIIELSFGLTWHADLTGLVPDREAREFWSRFWTGLREPLTAHLQASVAEPLEMLDEALERNECDLLRMLAAQFRACNEPSVQSRVEQEGQSSSDRSLRSASSPSTCHRSPSSTSR